MHRFGRVQYLVNLWLIALAICNVMVIRLDA
jgi:hypothetical protein